MTTFVRPIQDWSIQTKLITILCVVVFIYIANMSMIMNKLAAFTKKADIVSAQERFFGILDVATLRDAAFFSITRDYIESGNQSVRKSYDELYGAHDEFVTQMKATARDAEDASRAEEIIKVREKLFVIENRIIQLKSDGHTEDARALFSGEEYIGLHDAFVKMLSSIKEEEGRELKVVESERDSSMSSLSRIANAVLVTFAFLGCIVVFSITVPIMRTVREIEEAVLAIGRGETGKRILIRSRDEFGRMSIAFNKMAVVLDESKSSSRLEDITREIGE